MKQSMFFFEILAFCLFFLVWFRHLSSVDFHRIMTSLFQVAFILYGPNPWITPADKMHMDMHDEGHEDHHDDVDDHHSHDDEHVN